MTTRHFLVLIAGAHVQMQNQFYVVSGAVHPFDVVCVGSPVIVTYVTKKKLINKYWEFLV